LNRYQPSQADVVVFQSIGGAPPANLSHALRWYNQILSYGNDTAGFTGVKKPLSAYGPPATVGKPSNAADDDDDDDDDDEDLFGSDTEEDKVFGIGLQMFFFEIAVVCFKNGIYMTNKVTLYSLLFNRFPLNCGKNQIYAFS
jgi:hypothetical protein